MVRDDPKKLGDNGEVSFSTEEVGGLISVVQSSLYLMKKI